MFFFYICWLGNWYDWLVGIFGCWKVEVAVGGGMKRLCVDCELFRVAVDWGKVGWGKFADGCTSGGDVARKLVCGTTGATFIIPMS